MIDTQLEKAAVHTVDCTEPGVNYGRYRGVDNDDHHQPLVHNLLNEKMLKDVNKYLSSIVSAKVVVSQSDQLVWLVEVRSISHYT